MNSFSDFLNRKREEYGKKFDPSDLAPQFIPFYETGQRIEIEFSYGEKKRGTIGITTGWKPVFLLILTKRSHGSSYTLDAKDKIVKIIK